MTEQDRIVIENAALVLKSIADRVHANPDFAQHITHLPVPGGAEMMKFAHAISATATRYPTRWRRECKADYLAEA